jgi:hypothetical protein
MQNTFIARYWLSAIVRGKTVSEIAASRDTQYPFDRIFNGSVKTELRL